MDVNLVIRAVRKRQKFVWTGLGLALILAVLSYGTPGLNGLTPTLRPREGEIWTSETTLFRTQKGVPWGQAVATYRPSTGDGPAVLTSDQSRLSGLATLYAQLAESDIVKRIAKRQGPLDPSAEIGVEPITYTTAQFSYPQVLPLVRISATASGPGKAKQAVTRISTAFRTYVRSQQTTAKIAGSNRVVIQVLKDPSDPELLVGRSKFVPLAVLFVLALVVIGIALVLENMERTRRRVDRERAEAETAGISLRRRVAMASGSEAPSGVTISSQSRQNA